MEWMVKKSTLLYTQPVLLDHVNIWRCYATRLLQSCHLLSTMDRRRSVMQPVLDPLSNINARSGIPLPSTIKKPTPNTRMSLAGPALRPPNTSVPPGTNPRQSMIRSQNLNPLLQSTSKPNYGRTPLSKCVFLKPSVDCIFSE